jgi:ATP phosphoribosyltransferase
VRGRPWKLGLPKGRFESSSRTAIEYLGGQWVPGSLRFSVLEGTADVLLLKSRDIVPAVAGGELDFGIAPDEWFMEWEAASERRLTHFACAAPALPTRLSFFAHPDHEWRSGEVLRVATPFPALALREARNVKEWPHVEVLCVAGSTEAFVGVEAELGFDCVETGATLRSHGLLEVRTTHQELGLTVVHRLGRDVAESTVSSCLRQWSRAGSVSQPIGLQHAAIGKLDAR